MTILHWAIITTGRAAIMFHGTREEVRARWPVALSYMSSTDRATATGVHLSDARMAGTLPASQTVMPCP